MPLLIGEPAIIPVPGGKQILEYVGRARTGTEALSIAHMTAPPGWTEPYQQPAFDEITVVVRGTLRIEYGDGTVDVPAGQSVLVEADERIRYSNPFEAEAEYWAICTPAFSPEAARREAR